MSDKPVAWMARNELLFSVVKDEIHYIPLYTHPVKEPMMVLDGNRVYPAFKELTDEEIREIHEQTDGNLNMIEFARAILRKAQEK